jgi:hypothetical protein
MTKLLESYTKINKILKTHGNSIEYKRQINELNEDEKYVLNELKSINNFLKRKQNQDKKDRVMKQLEVYFNNQQTLINEN